MATIEKLFNFDDQLLTRELAGQREDTMFGNSMPKGYGAVGMGWNKMLRGLFNNNDPILKEKAIAEQALQMTQEQLGGDMSDPSKMYGVLMNNLNKLGASPKSISTVADKKALIDTNKVNASLDASFKKLALDQARVKQNSLESDKFKNYLQKVGKEISSELENMSDSSIKNYLIQTSNQLSDEDTDAAQLFTSKVLLEANKLLSSKTPDDKFNTQSILIEAIKEAGKKYTWDENWWGGDGKWVEINDGSTVDANEIYKDEELKSMVDELTTEEAK